MSDMTYAEAVEVLKRPDVHFKVWEDSITLSSDYVGAIELALRALEDVEIQAQVIIRQSQDIKDMRKAMNGQSEYAYLGGDLISREALIERMENVHWYSTNDKGVLHTGAACQKSAYVRWSDVAEVMEGALAVEAEPVVHAHWIMRGGRRYCSACGTMACVTRDREDFWYTVGTKRCPECGAHMDEEVAYV